MTQQNASGVMNIAAAFANLAGKAAAQANAHRREVADANIAAGRSQLNLQLKEERSRLASAFSKHQGTLAVNAAFRGSSSSDADATATLTSAVLKASNESAVAEANRSVQLAALRARNQFVEEDVALASIEGGLRGFNIGMDIANQLQALTEVRRETSVRIFGNGQTFGFENIIQDVANTPGFDLSSFGQGFGLNLGF